MTFDAKETAGRLRTCGNDCPAWDLLEAFGADFTEDDCMKTECEECRMALPAKIADALDPRDTQERIDADAAKDPVGYWGCKGVACSRCPAKVGGKTPAERYAPAKRMIGACAVAKTFDLLRRQRELDGRAL